MRRLIPFLLLACCLSVPAFSDSVTVLGGYALPSGDSDIFRQNERETNFEVNDLNDFTFTARYDHFFGDFVNLGGSVSFFDADTHVVDSDFEFENGDPITRRIRLQIVPVEVNLHFLPAGRNEVIIPYVGGGVGAYYWEYEEIGDFVFNRNTGNEIVRTGDAYSDGWDGGWHVEGGVQIPFSRSATFTAEAKYFNVDGDLDVRGFDASFEPIDLSMTSFSAGVSFWF
jgi:hypothetical protein